MFLAARLQLINPFAASGTRRASRNEHSGPEYAGLGHGPSVFHPGGSAFPDAYHA